MGEEKLLSITEVWTTEPNVWVAYDANEDMGPRNRAERRRSKTRCGARGCPREPLESSGRCEMHGGLRAKAKPLPPEGRWVMPDLAALEKQQEQFKALFQQGLVSWNDYYQQVVPAVEVPGPSGRLYREQMAPAVNTMLAAGGVGGNTIFRVNEAEATPPAKQPWVWGDV